MAFRRIRSRRGPLRRLRSCIERLVNFKMYVNLGYTLVLSTDHMVSRDALLRPIVSLILLIWSLTLLRWLVDRSGAMKAPRTLVGVLSGIGGIEMFAPSMARACRVG